MARSSRSGVTPHARRREAHPGLVLVCGVSGGVGASTLVGVLALEMARRTGTAVLVDGDLTGGGLDVTVGVEHLEGPRWPDLAQVRGEVDGAALLRLLPGTDGCRVLAADGRRSGDPLGRFVATAAVGASPGLGAVGELGAAGEHGVTDGLGAEVSVGAHARARVLRALRGAGGPLVIDAPRGVLVGLGADLGRAAGVLLLVTGTDVRRLADLDTAVSRLVDSGWAPGHGLRVGLVTRGSGLSHVALDLIAEQTGLPHLGHVPEDPQVVRDAVRGGWPGNRGRMRRMAGALLDGISEGALPPAAIAASGTSALVTVRPDDASSSAGSAHAGPAA